MKSFDLPEVLGLPDLGRSLQQVDAQLQHSLKTEVPAIAEPLQRLLKTSGKRLRASLVIAAAQANGVAPDKTVIEGAVAVELVHMASLIHDDAIDSGASRRGAQTVNAAEGYDWAVLVGDYVLAHSNRQAAQVSQVVAELVADTIAHLCEGQALEMASQFDLSRGQDNYLHAISLKTAALMSAACNVGCLTARASAGRQKALSTYGYHLGVAFQLIDDMLDFIGSAEALGKAPGNDVKEGVYTLPLILALESDQQVTQWFAHQEFDFQALVERLCEKGFMRQAMQLAEVNNAAAVDSLPDGKEFAGLRKLPNAYMSWALTELVDPRYRAAVTQ